MAKVKSWTEKIKALGENRANEIKALRILRSNLKQEIKDLDAKLHPLLIAEYEESSGLKPGTLIAPRGMEHRGKIFRVKEFTVTLPGTVKPRCEMVMKGGKVWPGVFTIYHDYRVLSEEEALEILRTAPAVELEEG